MLCLLRRNCKHNYNLLHCEFHTRLENRIQRYFYLLYTTYMQCYSANTARRQTESLKRRAEPVLGPDAKVPMRRSSRSSTGANPRPCMLPGSRSYFVPPSPIASLVVSGVHASPRPGYGRRRALVSAGLTPQTAVSKSYGAPPWSTYHTPAPTSMLTRASPHPISCMPHWASNGPRCTGVRASLPGAVYSAALAGPHSGCHLPSRRRHWRW